MYARMNNEHIHNMSVFNINKFIYVSVCFVYKITVTCAQYCYVDVSVSNIFSIYIYMYIYIYICIFTCHVECSSSVTYNKVRYMLYLTTDASTVLEIAMAVISCVCDSK